MKNKKSPAERLELYRALTKDMNGEDLFALYVDLKNIDVVKSPAAFQEYINNLAINAIQRYINEVKFA